MDRAPKMLRTCNRSDKSNVTKYPTAPNSLFYIHDDFDDFTIMKSATTTTIKIIEQTNTLTLIRNSG